MKTDARKLSPQEQCGAGLPARNQDELDRRVRSVMR